MRIIRGKYGRRRFDVPTNITARPTTDMARENIFNVLENLVDFEGIDALDLFAGTGAISFEFASRGAARVYCVEMARENASFIKREAARLGLGNVTMVRDNVFDFLPICTEKFDLIFADPPYALEGLETLPDKVLGQNILHPECYFILEHGDAHSFREHPRFKKEKVYGRVHFTFFEQPE